MTCGVARLAIQFRCPARSAIITRRHRQRRVHLGKHRDRFALLAGPPSSTRTRFGSRGRPACASVTYVELERSEIKRAPDGSARSSCPRTSGGGASSTCRSPRPPRRSLKGADLAPPDPEAVSRRHLGLRPAFARGSRVCHRVRFRPEFRFNDLRGTKVTEIVWSGISVPDLAICIGWKIETAAKMLGVHAALNPGRAMVVRSPRGEAGTMLLPVELKGTAPGPTNRRDRRVAKHRFGARSWAASSPRMKVTGICEPRITCAATSTRTLRGRGRRMRARKGWRRRTYSRILPWVPTEIGYRGPGRPHTRAKWRFMPA